MNERQSAARRAHIGLIAVCAAGLFFNDDFRPEFAKEIAAIDPQKFIRPPAGSISSDYGRGIPGLQWKCYAHGSLQYCINPVPDFRPDPDIWENNHPYAKSTGEIIDRDYQDAQDGVVELLSFINSHRNTVCRSVAVPRSTKAWLVGSPPEAPATMEFTTEQGSNVHDIAEIIGCLNIPPESQHASAQACRESKADILVAHQFLSGSNQGKVHHLYTPADWAACPRGSQTLASFLANQFKFPIDPKISVAMQYPNLWRWVNENRGAPWREYNLAGEVLVVKAVGDFAAEASSESKGLRIFDIEIPGNAVIIVLPGLILGFMLFIATQISGIASEELPLAPKSRTWWALSTLLLFATFVAFPSLMVAHVAGGLLGVFVLIVAVICVWRGGSQRNFALALF